ncbi:exotoxin type C [Streptococcus pyogenes]|uniref:exotoxin beta-grasp domain-containing protein n=1 Tax=Streptococcus pyogenes TaxID=1314 RepID=UPI0010D7B0B8|nr:exotoxin beta-grasp domain-containing protein [Streptococcus pyogenes]VGV62849.1 exotoxin type C [Streptococcus pyogenes]VGV82821.1 exotoxin type C [Streptococcus pyogenes]VHM85479.1 exotoxin type C [Streptococcus pyogenes]VHN15178.1 exotoxin type C [Streptococcus pyogenes]VHN17125.1 exotoxin type C [Streptococcus pyogenes]
MWHIYIYGGVTNSESNKYYYSLKGNLFIKDEAQTLTLHDIAISTKTVTLQELDYKIRKFLNEKYHIYEFKGKYNFGKVEFSTKDSKSYVFNLFDVELGRTDYDHIFRKYRNNDTIKMEDFSHFDVYLDY